MTPPVALVIDQDLSVIFMVIEANLSWFWTSSLAIDSYFSLDLKEGIIYLNNVKIMDSIKTFYLQR